MQLIVYLPVGCFCVPRDKNFYEQGLRVIFIKKLLLLLSLTPAFGISSAFAQFDAIKRLDFYVGFSNTAVEADTSNLFIGRPRGVAPFPGTTEDNGFFRRRTGFNGAEVSAGGNISRYLGLKGSVSATYRDQQFGFRVPTNAAGTTSGNATLRTRDQLYNFVGGVQFKNNGSKARVTPFGHAMVGVGYGRTRIRGLTVPSGTSAALANNFAANDSDTGFAAVLGGGLDVKLKGRFGLRVIQIDYNPVHLNNRTLDNVRFGGGITF